LEDLKTPPEELEGQFYEQELNVVEEAKDDGSDGRRSPRSHDRSPEERI